LAAVHISIKDNLKNINEKQNKNTTKAFNSLPEIFINKKKCIDCLAQKCCFNVVLTFNM
jgi:hypothetical protein